MDEGLGKLIEDEEMAEGEVKVQVYWTYIKAMSTPLAATALIGSLAMIAVVVLLNWWLSVWSEDGYRNVTDYRSLAIYRITVYSSIGAAQS